MKVRLGGRNMRLLIKKGMQRGKVGSDDAAGDRVQSSKKIKRKGRNKRRSKGGNSNRSQIRQQYKYS